MTPRSFLATALLALAALSGCRIEKPATVVPAPALIEAFTTSSGSVASGERVTLNWKTSQATAIELREASTGALGVATDAFEGTLEITVTANALFVLTARGPGGTDARALSVTIADTGPGEVIFQALPPTIVGGESTTLVWSAPGATSVTLLAGTQPIDVGGQRASGAVTVSPLFDTTYSLTAGALTRTVVVSVQPSVLTLTATPTAVAPGEAITLAWTAAGAERLVISSPGRGQLAEITDPARIASGNYTDTAPQLPTGGLVAYEISAIKGTATRSQRTDVFVGKDLTIVRFDAPPVAAAGASYQVRWQTLAADLVEIKLDGVVIRRSSSLADAASGVLSITAPATDFAIELVASSARGERKSQVLQVDVVGIPTAATLTASPTTVTAGQPVTLTFASLEARRARIVDSDGETVFSVTGQRAEGGTAVVTPSADTTYTLLADNLLGNAAVTATAQVTVTGAALTVTQFPPTAISGQNVDLRSNQTGALFYGFPHSRVERSSQADFIDISGTGTRVLESGGSVTTVDLPFATWLWGIRQTGSLTISRAGWMAWGAPLVVNTANASSLPSTATSAAPGLIAPYWDNLTLTGTNSVVFAQLVGNAPDQSLVVQWDGLEVASSDSTEVTFQARVHQNGVVSFHYKTMTLDTTPSFTIGVQDNTRTLAVESTATPTSNSAVYFFSPVTSVSTRVAKGSRWGGVVQVGNARTRVSQPAVAVNVPGDLAVSEFMFRPSPSVTNGQYVELFNRTNTALDMTGWELRSTASVTPFTVTGGFTLAPGFTVIGASTDPLENDDAGVSLSWGSFSVSPDAGTLTFSNADAGLTFPYQGPSDAGTGASLEIDFSVNVQNSSATRPSCLGNRTFGGQTPLQRGTPGSQAYCFGYAPPVSIPSRYVDISATGTALVNSPATAVDELTVPITLAATAGDPAPVSFGVRRPVISMSVSGWLVWGSTTVVNFSNKTTPNTTDPVGSIAPFWDDMTTVVGRPSDMYWKRFGANEDPVTTAPHWVFMWHHLRRFSFSVTPPLDDLNFEVKIFEDGTIEYHYGTMTSGSSSNYANGNSATVWLEEPTGNYGFSLSINQPVVAPNTAWRFVPQ